MLTRERIAELRNRLIDRKTSGKVTGPKRMINLKCATHIDDAIEYANEVYDIDLPNSIVVRKSKVGLLTIGKDSIVIDSETIPAKIFNRGTQKIPAPMRKAGRKYTVILTEEYNVIDVEISSAWFIALSFLCELNIKNDSPNREFFPDGEKGDKAYRQAQHKTRDKTRKCMNELPFVHEIIFEYATGGTATTKVLEKSTS